MAVWHTPDEIATLLKVGKEKVIGLILTGELAAADLDGSGDYRIRQNDLEAFLEKQHRRTSQTAAKVQAKLATEATVFKHLYLWLQTENHSLSDIYKKVDECVLQVVDQFKMGRDAGLRAGEHARAQAFEDALLALYERLEKPKQSYQQWVMDFEKRWQIFVAQIGLLDADKVGVLAPVDPLTAVDTFLLAVMDAGSSSGFNAYRQQKDMYQMLYLWTKRENASLIAHYRRMERTFTKLVDGLRNMAKKASRSLEFERGQACQEAAMIIYREWENAQAEYNHWLLRRQERWRKCYEQVVGESGVPPPDDGPDPE
ncbi:MAG: helix-turn-helix domain-containing protein [Heliobacteriaceae bacterium]|nr:helix-turn-helix domain-containing protein [Heliobacteriaceae bacterium]MDD4587322.1 helix-turn-helix domain-containing protein [Heliobacteriaceae bacterium]